MKYEDANNIVPYSWVMKTRTRPDVRPEDLELKRFGRLVAVEIIGRLPVRWFCICDCGNYHSVTAAMLKRSLARSCGCLRKEASAERVRTHGKRRTAIYGLWCHMKARCSNPNTDAYPDYGGRGIKVCERWLSFTNFFADMGHRPEGKSLERRDNNGNYEPSNCYWATVQEQSRNRRNTVMIEAFGVQLTQAEWARKLNVRDAAICTALRRGRTLEQFASHRGISAR